MLYPTNDHDDIASSNGSDVMSEMNDDTDNADGNSTTGNADMMVGDSNHQVKRLAYRETRHVTYLRLGLLILLVMASAATATVVYLFVQNGEQQEFEESFVSYGTKLTEAFQSIADRRLGAIASLSIGITSYALESNVSWPFVTVPQYEAQVRHVMKLAGVDAITFAPLVTAEDRKAWETEFIPNNIDSWRVESVTATAWFDPLMNATAQSQPRRDVPPMEPYEGMPDTTKGYSAQIMEAMIGPKGIKFVISNGDGPFLPWWQSAPFTYGVTERQINIDLNKDPTFNNDLIDILSRQEAALGKLTTNGYGRSNNPASGFYYPVLNDIAPNSTLAASLGTLIRWLQYFGNILPNNAIGFIGVIYNTCNQTFTFRVDGSDVSFIGDGDQHDPHYDYLKLEASFLDLINKSIESKNYIGLPLNDAGCQYTLTVYASSDMEDTFMSNKPVVYTVVALLIFLVTSLLFLLYDRLVERRQRLVMKEAESSGAIVSSLFPAAYRERLMAAQASRHRPKDSKKSTTFASDSNKSNDAQLMDFFNGSSKDIAMWNTDEPIADMFPECTVLFADISGFTNWSSTREPTQVFCLLQEVFGELDRIAKRLRIFKVETIGDCYMAVTGLPNPQPNHARLMARFANECLIKMRDITSRLSDTLGEGTGDLTLRIGLHSGPVTAGILRGEKSRFQLFGDTVNTASRMESTGVKNRIQVSSTTADHIRQAGKGHWLLPRKDLVEAKGKGVLQTYWLTYERAQSINRSLPLTLGTSKDSDDENYDDGVNMVQASAVPSTAATTSPSNDSSSDLLSI